VNKLKTAGILTVFLLLAGSAWATEDGFGSLENIDCMRACECADHLQIRQVKALEDIAAALKGESLKDGN